MEPAWAVLNKRYQAYETVYLHHEDQGGGGVDNN